MSNWLEDVLSLADSFSGYNKMTDTSYVIPLFNLKEEKAEKIKTFLLTIPPKDIIAPFKSAWSYASHVNSSEFSGIGEQNRILSKDDLEDIITRSPVLFGFKKDGITISFFIGIDDLHFFSKMSTYNDALERTVDLISFMLNFESEYLKIPENKLSFLEEYIMKCRNKL